DVEPEAGAHGAAHGALLPEAAIALLFGGHHLVPDTPFVQDDAAAAARVVAIQQGALCGDALFHIWEDAELLVHGSHGEFGGNQVAAFIEVGRPAVGQAPGADGTEEVARPVHVVAIRPAGYQEKLGSTVGAHVVGEDAVHFAVMLGRHGSAAAPV